MDMVDWSRVKTPPLTAETGGSIPLSTAKTQEQIVPEFFVCALQQKHFAFYFEYAILASVKSP